jgi:hypothetical protein
MMNNEHSDTTIADIHRIRREIAAKFKDDLFAINADAQARSEASQRQIIRRPSSFRKVMDPGSESKATQVKNPLPAAG